MKYILILFFTITASAQFSVNGNKFIWQTIDTTNVSTEDYYKKLSETNNFKDILIIEDRITGMVKPFRMDRSDCDKKPYLIDYSFKADIVIDFKDSKKRITLSNFIAINNTGIYGQIGGERTIESMILNSKNDIRKNFLSNDIECLNSAIIKLFELDEW